MDLLGYLDKFGTKSFLDRPFNDVDALICAQLSYINFELCAPTLENNSLRPLALKDLDLSLAKKLSKDEFTQDKNPLLLTKLKSSVRYQDAQICYIEDSHCLSVEKQFYALTIILPNGIRYISFRGTDWTLVGWKEDCNMSFIEEVPSQTEAINYVKKVTNLFKEDFYIGGHSKGGNLSFYAAIMMDEDLKNRCLKAYSFDGPGFHDDSIYKCDGYIHMKKKLVKFVPFDSCVGVILSHIKNPKVVDAHSLGVLQHNPYNWKIDAKTGEFIFKEKRAASSYILERAFSQWLNSLSMEERKLTTESIFELLGGTKNNLSNLTKNFYLTIHGFIRVHASYSKETKEKLNDILKRLFYYHKRAKAYFAKKENVVKSDKLTCIKEGE